MMCVDEATRTSSSLPDCCPSDSFCLLPLSRLNEECARCAQSSLIICDNMGCIVHQAPQSVKFFRQEYWTGLPFPTPGDLLDPEIQSISPASPALAGRFFTTAPPGRPRINEEMPTQNHTDPSNL